MERIDIRLLEELFNQQCFDRMMEGKIFMLYHKVSLLDGTIRDIDFFFQTYFHILGIKYYKNLML